MGRPLSYDPAVGKECLDCGEVRPLSEFHATLRPGRLTPSYSTRCKKHHAIYTRAWRLAKYGSETAARHQHRWGLTPEDFQALLDAQGGVCAICQRPPRGGTHDRVLHVDHDHVTDEVRGLLCRSCNTALHLLDDPVKRQRALAYLGFDTKDTLDA